MFERFTDSAIKVIMLAQEEARCKGHNHVATEQILLGLIGEGKGLAAKILKTYNVKISDARAHLDSAVGQGSDEIGEEMPFTPGAKRVLEYAWKEAQQFGVDYIDTEQLLLGLARVEEDHALIVLHKLGVPIGDLRGIVIEYMDRAAGNVRQQGRELPTVDFFSDDLLRTFIVAREETRRLGHGAVSSELLLLGLIGEENGPAAETLRLQGVTLDNARWEAERVIGRGYGVIPVDSPFTDLTKDILKIAAALASKASHESVTGEHVLIALIGIKCAGVEAILKNLSVDNVKLMDTSISRLSSRISSSPNWSSASSRPYIERAIADLMRETRGKLASFVSPAADLTVRYERFAVSAAEVIKFAREEARSMGNQFIGTDHILLGLIHEGKGIVATALESEGLAFGDARRVVQKLIGQSENVVGEVSYFTPKARRSINFAWEEAKSRGQTYISSELLLLGLLRELEGIATPAMVNLDVDPERLRVKINQLIAEGGEATA